MFQVLFFFHNFLQNSLQKSFEFIYFLLFYKFTKIRIKSFECPKSIRNYEKIMLGTLHNLSMSCLSHRPIKPAYHTEDFWDFWAVWATRAVRKNIFNFKPSYFFSWVKQIRNNIEESTLRRGFTILTSKYTLLA